MFACRLLQLHLKRRCRAYSQSPAFKNDVLDKIVFNSVLQSTKTSTFWKNVRVKAKSQKRVETKCDVEPVVLQYLDSYVKQSKVVESKDDVVKDKPLNFPYSIVSEVKVNKDDDQNYDTKDTGITYDRKYYCDTYFFFYSFIISCR